MIMWHCTKKPSQRSTVIKGMLKTDDEVTVEHNATFLRWFKQQVLENPPEEGSSDGLLVHALAHGPVPKLATY